MRCQKYGIPIPDVIERQVFVDNDKFYVQLRVVDCRPTGIECNLIGYATAKQLNANERRKKRIPGTKGWRQTEQGITVFEDSRTVITPSGLHVSPRTEKTGTPLYGMLHDNAMEALAKLHPVYEARFKQIDLLGGKCEIITSRLHDFVPGGTTSSEDVFRHLEEMIEDMGQNGKKG